MPDGDLADHLQVCMLSISHFCDNSVNLLCGCSERFMFGFDLEMLKRNYEGGDEELLRFVG